MSRTGVLSDASVQKMCSTHFPLPMKYNLPRNTQMSPFHSKKLKYQPAVSRPDTFNSLKMSMAKLGGASEEELTSMYAAELRNNVHASDINRPRPPQTFGGGGPGGGNDDDDNNDNDNGNDNVNDNGDESADDEVNLIQNPPVIDQDPPDTAGGLAEAPTPTRSRFFSLMTTLGMTGAPSLESQAPQNDPFQERSTQTDTLPNEESLVQSRIQSLEKRIREQTRTIEKQRDERDDLRRVHGRREGSGVVVLVGYECRK